MKNRQNKKRPIILIAFREGVTSGGPYNSHKRIIENCKSEEYLLKPFYFPRSKVLLSLRGMLSIVKKIKNENPIAVQIIGLQIEGFMTLIACKLARVKVILAIHGSMNESTSIKRTTKYFYSLLERFTVKKADIVFGVSDYVSNWSLCQKCHNYFGTIYNLPEFINKTNNHHFDKSLYNIKKDDIIITSTGRITKEKGFDILLELMEIYQEYDNVHFIIVGDGNYRQVMDSKVLASKLCNVHILGNRDDINLILKASDIFIICSRHETLCMSLQEAGLMGLPLIAANVGGVPEIIDESCGILIENENIKEFATALSSLINDNNERIRLGENAKIKMKTKFSKESIIKKLDLLYKEILYKGGKRR